MFSRICSAQPWNLPNWRRWNLEESKARCLVTKWWRSSQNSMRFFLSLVIALMMDWMQLTGYGYSHQSFNISRTWLAKCKSSRSRRSDSGTLKRKKKERETPQSLPIFFSTLNIFICALPFGCWEQAKCKSYILKGRGGGKELTLC